MKLYAIETGCFKLDGGAMFGVVPKAIWKKLNPPDELNLCTWAMRCLLVEDGKRLVLVDTGIGNKQDDKFFSHYHLHGPDSLQGSLEKLGFTANDITDVLLTHLHFDHCGGAIMRKGEALSPAFPNATYHSHERHWQWATHPNAREKASFLKDNIEPIRNSGQLNFISTSDEKSILKPFGTGIVEGLDCLLAGGHTEAMMLPVIKYKGRTIVYMADLLPSTAHIPLPYVMAYDMFPLTTLEEKAAFFKEAIDNDYVLFFEHDPLHACCTLQLTEKGVRVKETFPLTAL